MLVTPAWLLSAELAQSSQEHLQRSVKYGGRRRLPYPGEMKALLVLGVLPRWGELGPLSTHRWADSTTCLAERKNGLPASNSSARGRALQDQNPHFHGEHKATRGAGKRQGSCGRQFRGHSQAPSIMACPHAQVAAEVLEELCEKMGIMDPEEVQEFALFLVKGEGEPPCQAGFRAAASLPGPPWGP